MSVVAELRRRNVFRVAILYGLTAWIILQVAGLLFGLLQLPDWAGRLVFGLLVLGFPLVLIFSWIYELTPEGLKKQHEVDRGRSTAPETGRRINYLIGALAAIAILMIVLERFLPRPGLDPGTSASDPAGAAAPAESIPSAAHPPVHAASIAVLPFVNMSSDAGNEYFSDGLSEELLNMLAKLPKLKVIARTSSFAYKGKDLKIPEIARELQVAHVLEGSVRKSGEKVRITAQLISGADGTHVWSETYDRTLDDIFAVQDDIAAQVVNALELTLLGDKPSASPGLDPKAYTQLLQARFLAQRQVRADVELGIRHLVQFLQSNPDYAPAWVDLAKARIAQAEAGWAPSTDAFAQARKSVESALSLDPDLASAHAAMGWIHDGLDWDWPAAETSFRKALAAEPDNADALRGRGLLAGQFGRPEEALSFMRRALEIDPLSQVSHQHLAYVLNSMGRHRDAEAAYRKAQEVSGQSNGASIGISLLLQGKAEAALREIERDPDEIWRLYGLALAYHSLQRRSEADSTLASLKREHSAEIPSFIAEVHAWRGENDLAFTWLDRAYAQRDLYMADIKLNPLIARLAGDPRYKDLLRKMHLPE